MVTVAIVTILATIAVTSYTSQIQKSRRTEAKSALLDLAGPGGAAVQHHHTYSADEAFLDNATASTPMTNMNFGNGYYQLTAVATATTYTLTANPVGAKRANAACGSFLRQPARRADCERTSTVASCWGD